MTSPETPPLPPLEPFLVDGPAGPIEGRLELPDRASFAAPRFLAVFGHPHPQHGGTMQNSVVVHGARALSELGGAVARFNFRGVGRSAGRFDEGRGELADYRAVVAFVRARWPGERSRPLPFLAAGFSFGSIRALECAALGEADLYLGIAPPITLTKYVDSTLPGGGLPAKFEGVAALVLAGNDELVTRPSAAELAARFGDLRSVETIADAGHLFFGKIKELAQAVERAGRRLLEG